MISQELKNFFPHSTIRDGQKELVIDIATAFQQNKILLAHAPTGLGKTASALTVALQNALQQKKKVFFLTNRHTQHHIAIETLKLIKKKTNAKFSCVDIIGKKWMCNQEISGLFGGEFHEYCKAVVEKGECEFFNNARKKQEATVEAKVLVNELQATPLHNEQVISRSQERRMCSYEISLEVAKTADVIIGDYNYIFNNFIQASLFKKLNINIEDVILIVDEGHNLPNRIRDMVSNSLTSIMIKNSIHEAKKFNYHGLIEWLQKLMEILNSLSNYIGKEQECLIRKEQFIRKVSAIVDYEQFTTELENAADEVRKKQRKSSMGGIASFLESWQGEEDGFTRILSEKQGKYGSFLTLSYLCLDPSIVTKPIFNQIYSGVIMSGTLQPTFMFKDLLGIENSIEKTYGSPFPASNKLSLVVPETTTKFTARSEQMFQNIAEKTTKISELMPGNVAAFFPSYHLRDTVGSMIKTKKELFWEKRDMSKEEKEIFLAQFKASKNGLLLAITGANFAEGIDFPGDLLNGVIVVGLPLARPDLLTKEIINYYQQKFGKGWEYGYTFPAMSKCIQSAGRCIRSETDKGAVIYLDERFSWERYYSCLPRERLIVTKSYDKFLKEFFNKSLPNRTLPPF
jgi:DNA excision repair protein ERCC-2